MIIDPLNIKKEQKIKNKDDLPSSRKTINAIEIQKYLIDNYINYIKEENRDMIQKKIEEYIYENSYKMHQIEINNLITYVINKMFGYHILQKYIETEDISDIRVVRYNQIYIKRKGIWEKTDESFEDEQEFYEYVRFCILKNDGSINFDTPIIVISDKKNNLRIEAGISPVNTISPSIVIRIHRYNVTINLERLYLVEEMIDSKVYKFLIECVYNNKNIVISGKGGSGKTTLLKGIINEIPDETPITVNEETMELYFQNKNIIQREVIQNRDEAKNITLQKLMKHSLVMSNDVLVIGELKGEEASIFFDAIATGHVGYSTVHSDSAYNTIGRLVTLVKRDIKSQKYKEEYIEKLLASSIDYIIYMSNYKVNQIISVSYNNTKKEVVFNELYKI